MKKTIFLNRYKDINSIDKNNKVSLEIKGNQKLLPVEPISNDIDLYQLYCEEIDKTTKYRMLFTLEPIFTNVLFNTCTEIVSKEGSNDTNALNNNEQNYLKNTDYTKSFISLTRKNALRNTEFSNSVHNLDYHCGIDIFNNHILRSKEFTPILDRANYKSVEELLKKQSVKSRIYKFQNGKRIEIPIDDVFNTIMDINRDNGKGEIETKLIGEDHMYLKYVSPLHLYYADNTLSLDDCITNKLKEKDGWFGFYNQGNIKKSIITRSGKEIFVNKCINNKNECEFVDLYPDRTLFNFSPKKNAYRDRLEYNWKYFLTYPYKNSKNGYGILDETENGLPLYPFSNGNLFEEFIGPNGLSLCRFMSVVSHNLSPNDIIEFNYKNEEKIRCKVMSVGDADGKDKSHYFTVKKMDIENEEGIYDFRHFIKIVNGYECKYYFRVFKKYKNKNNKVPTSLINSLSFSQNIYGDEISQIQFMEDIDIADLKDNLGRPVTEMFLTFIKNNAGYKKWYNIKPIYNDSDIEYSHAFGKITSGLDIPFLVNDKSFPSIRRQHNITNTGNFKIEGTSAFIEEDINDSFDEFIGDLVEYRIDKTEETVLEPILYRFNTGQREFCDLNNFYDTLFEDYIMEDDFDKGSFKLLEIDKYKGYANLNPEGYVYKPNFKIKLKSYNETVKQNSDLYIKVTDINKTILDTKTIVDINLVSKTEISDYEKIIVINGDNFAERYIGSVIQNTNDKLLKVEFNDRIDFDLNNGIFFKKNPHIPDYAQPLEDGSGRYIWREINKNSTVSFEDEISKRPFTNGAIYIQENVIFPLKRQNPFKDEQIEMSFEGKKYNPLYTPSSKKYDESFDEMETLNNDTTCW